MQDLSSLIVSALSRDYAAMARHTGRNMVLYSIAGVLLLTAYVAGVAALAIYLATLAGAAVAMLSVALGALLLGLILIAVIVSGNRREREIQMLREQIMREQAARPSSLTNAILTAVPLVTRGSPFASVFAAALAAFVAGLAGTGRK